MRDFMQLSTPKQERWMAAHVGLLKAPVLIGVGAAFDFHAGVKRQAPRWTRSEGASHEIETLFILESKCWRSSTVLSTRVFLR